MKLQWGPPCSSRPSFWLSATSLFFLKRGNFWALFCGPILGKGLFCGGPSRPILRDTAPKSQWHRAVLKWQRNMYVISTLSHCCQFSRRIVHRVLELDVGELFIDAINELSREFVFDVTCRVFDSFCNILCTCVSAGKSGPTICLGATLCVVFLAVEECHHFSWLL